MYLEAGICGQNVGCEALGVETRQRSNVGAGDLDQHRAGAAATAVVAPAGTVLLARNAATAKLATRDRDMHPLRALLQWGLRPEILPPVTGELCISGNTVCCLYSRDWI